MKQGLKEDVMMILQSRTDETVLVVDDDPGSVKLLNHVLKFEGLRVSEDIGARDARDLIAKLHPKLVLIDLQVTGTGAVELARELKADARTRRVPVVAVAASAMPGDENPALRAGACRPDLIQRFFGTPRAEWARAS